jgi:hypothetical protein
MRLFDFLENLHKESEKNIIIIPVEEPKPAKDKTTEIKEYKRLYYLQNLQTYKERNKEYRERKRKEKEEEHLKNNKNIIIV